MDLRFGSFLFRPAERQIVGPDGPLDLPARAFDLLALMLGTPDEVLRKDRILDCVWPGMTVAENTLHVHVSALRKALGAGMIMTVHGQGYKFTGPRPEAVPPEAAPPEAAPPQPAGAPTESQNPKFNFAGKKRQPVTGGCFCGEIRYRITEPALDTLICHCRMCQKFSGAPFTLGSVYPTDGFSFTAGAPKYFRSSPFAERGFCGTCGSSLVFKPVSPAVTPDWDGWILVETGTLDDPFQAVPQWQLGIESQMPWLNLDIGHTRVRCQDLPDVVDAWAAFGLPVP